MTPATARLMPLRPTICALDIRSLQIGESWEITRDAWRDVGVGAGVPVVEFELICSDSAEHRARVESRTVAIANFKLPGWEDVLARDYQPWCRDPLRIDTAGRSVAECVALMRSALAAE